MTAPPLPLRVRLRKLPLTERDRTATPRRLFSTSCRDGAAGPALRYVVAAVAAAMSLYHMYVAAFGPPEAFIFRGTHLLFAITLVYILYPLMPGRRAAWRLLDLGDARRRLGESCCTSSSTTSTSSTASSTSTITDVGSRSAGVACWSCSRGRARDRLGAAAHGDRVPRLRVLFTSGRWRVLLEQLYFSTEGIFGSTLGVSASYVMLFVLFGASWRRAARASSSWISR